MMDRGLPLITYAPGEGSGGAGQISYTFLLRIIYMHKGRRGVQIAWKNTYVINGRPHSIHCNSFLNRLRLQIK